MADNAPNAVDFAPRPNVVAGFNKRLKLHIVNATGANGSVTYNAARSTPGTGITRTGEGLYTVSFPPGGTGAIGWLQASMVESATNDVTIARAFSNDNDVTATQFASGSAGIVSVDFAATPAVNDVIGDFNILVWVLSA